MNIAHLILKVMANNQRLDRTKRYCVFKTLVRQYHLSQYRRGKILSTSPWNLCKFPSMCAISPQW